MNVAEERWALLRLCLSGFLKRGSCWVLLLGALLFVWVMPLLTPWDEHPQILQPAHAQAAWIYAWLALFTWFPFQAALLGKRMRSEGLLEFLHACGWNPARLYFQMGVALGVCLLAMALVAGFICVTVCLPRNAQEAWLWGGLVGQYACLYLASGIPLLFFGMALGTRCGEIVGFITPIFLLFVGIVAALWIVPLPAGSDSPLFRTLWLLLPHYHLADLTPRLVFKLGPLAGNDFVGSLGCLFLQGCALTVFGRCLFRTRS